MPTARAPARRLALVAALLTSAALGAQDVPRWSWLSTEDLGCLTPPPALAEVGLAGTDLGVTFPCGDRLVFLFGDSWTLDRREQDADSVATAPLGPLPDHGLPQLRWLRRDGGRFAPLAPRGHTLAGMNVPVDGIAIGERTFVFFSDGWDRRRARHSHSLCAHTTGAQWTRLETDHRVATERFVNVSLVADGDDVWIFGSGAYRKSPVFLARVAAARLADRSAWRYWPDFGPDEASAQPLVASDCIGELSVRRVPGSDLWWMTVNAAQPRGIQLRVAAAPTGPWSDAIVVWDPTRDRGYGHVMHQQNGAVGFDDGLAEPGREEDWGGEYGPYLVPEWCSRPTPGVMQLVYVLSTWNPYTVRVVRSTVVADGVEWKAPTADAKPAKAARAPRNLEWRGGRLTHWQQEGDRFACIERDGEWFVCTFVAPRGDAVRGRLWQEFTVPANATELRGRVWGGTEAIELWCGDEVLRRTRGPRTNDAERAFRWRLDAFRGRTVRLQIVDDATTPWGFVSVAGLQLVE